MYMTPNIHLSVQVSFQAAVKPSFIVGRWEMPVKLKKEGYIVYICILPSGMVSDNLPVKTLVK